MSNEAASVSFETAEGTKVTCSPDLARKLGYVEYKSPAKKSASSKSSK